MKEIELVQLLDNLVEITHHLESKRIKSHYFASLKSYCEADRLWLYKIHYYNSGYEIQLIAREQGQKIEINENSLKTEKVPEFLKPAFIDMIKNKQTITLKPDNDKISEPFILYPALNSSDNVYIVLVLASPGHSPRRAHLIHSLHKIYCSYIELLDKSQRDKLTNLLNRETLHDEITNILINVAEQKARDLLKDQEQQKYDSRNYTENPQFWLGVLDIDYFKKINDTYGHLYGDEILIMVAQLLQKNLRDFDLVFRYGGEEFVILLYAANPKEAREAFNRIRLTIKKHRFAKIDTLTVSIGAVMIKDQTTSSTVISQADTALYYSKEHGRDQVNCYQDLLESGVIAAEPSVIDEDNIDFF